MDKIGYETISGTERPAQIVTARLEDEPVRRIASVECQLKKLGDASLRLGYGTLTH
jgi:hypothetical protein